MDKYARQTFIANYGEPKYYPTDVYEKKSERLLLSYLKMEYTEQVVSDSMLYKQAGNSIAVGVLERILKPIVNILNEKN